MTPEELAQEAWSKIVKNDGSAQDIIALAIYKALSMQVGRQIEDIKHLYSKNKTKEV